MKSVAVVGTGLIGASIALALRAGGFTGEIVGVDRSEAERAAALATGAFTTVSGDEAAVRGAEVVVLAVPVMAIMDWMQRLAPMLGEGQLVTDVGSTKREIVELARQLYNQPDRARFLPGHPMAGKESGGAALAEAGLFRGAVWLFTPIEREPSSDAGDDADAVELEWRGWVECFGAKAMEIDAEAHDEVCAWVSHLPQFLSTALAALLEEAVAGDAEGLAMVRAIGGRALKETTRLGASPYSMWRDVAMTNTESIAETLLALEQRLAHVRENLRTAELREEFAKANRFRTKQG
ncbi:MAG TPA: prephenate dehydrogenase [Acidobacteriaceae bacterium]|jgi:prephenate dehydrogenase|nr:prephenate dehydrogenase [Acidobacteriaceae bacterium]